MSARLHRRPLASSLVALVLAGTGAAHAAGAADPRVPPAPAVPYVNVVVELVEQPGLYLLTDLPGDDPALPAALRVGAPMRASFQRIGDAYTLPQFRPTGDAR